ncbi:MAG: NUDIX domain-containing protein [Rhodospirillales bacterium]
MPVHSAGILLFRYRDDGLQVLLVHPGGPFWARKDQGAWSIPKGEFIEGEHPLSAARREFTEETNVDVDGAFIDLGALRQPSGKVVHAWAVEQDLDADAIESNRFEMEWPRGSGVLRSYPEVDKAGWFPIGMAREKILKGQAGFLDRLLAILGD